MDYKKLLRRYVQAVAYAEGDAFAVHLASADDENFTDEERAIFQQFLEEGTEDAST